MIKLIFFLGLIFAFFIPPFQKPDENRHYYQSYAFSQGNFTCKTDNNGQVYLPVPASVYTLPNKLKVNEIAHTPAIKFFRSQFNWFLLPKDDPIIQVTDWCSWSFFGYLPSAFGLMLGNLSGSLLVSFYLARFLNFIVFFVALGYGLRLTPKQDRCWLYLYSLLPMTLHQATAISYDAVHLSMVPLVFGYLTQYIHATRFTSPVRVPYGFILSLLIFVIAKPAFIPFLLLLFLIPRQKVSHLIISFILCVIIVLPFLRPQYYRDTHPGVNTQLQLSVIMRDPAYYLNTLSRSIQLDVKNNLEGLIGTLGWLDYGFPYHAYVIVFIIFGYLMAHNSKSIPPLPNRFFVLLSFVLFTTLIAIYSSLYLIWSLVGDSRIVGVQGRYFLPFVPFLGVLLHELISRAQTSKRFALILFTLFSFWLTYQVVSTIYIRYYDYSHYGVNDLAFSLSFSPISAEPRRLPIPAKRAKGIGFAYQIAEESKSWTAYRYLVKSTDCTQILRVGYLHFADLVPGTVYREEVRPFWIENGSYCLTLEPLNSVSPPSVEFQPLYLVPSLTN